MATTTTYAAIRDNWITLIEALTPAVLPEYKFRRAPRHKYLDDFASETGSAAMRAFSIELEDQDPDPFTMPFETVERNERALISVAYPVAPALYGRTDFDEMEVVMRRDARQIRDLLFSSSSYLAGQSAAFPARQTLDRGDDHTWFLTLRVSLIYTEAQSLT